MTDVSRHIANLSTEKRRLLELLLQEEGVSLPPPPIERRNRDSDRVPLSFAQQRLWFLDQLDPGSPLYNLPVAVRLRGRLDVAALQRTLDEIVRRHEVLRTTFAAVDGDPVQIIKQHVPVTMRIVEVERTAGDQDAEIQRLTREDARRPFDLTEGPLLRVTLLRFSETDHVLLLTMHHIVSDGWSVGVLIQEVATLYKAFSTGQRPPLTEPAIQYADFALWQRAWLQGRVLEKQLAYWKDQLADAPPELPLPTDRPRPAIQTNRGAPHHFTLPAALVRDLRGLGRRHDATLFMTLLAAFQVLLYRYTGQEDVCVGSPVANRNHEQTKTLIGFFVNMLVLRGDLSASDGPSPTFVELLERTRQVTLDAYEHQDLPFEKLVEELQPERNRSHMPLFQVIFDLNNNPRQSLHLPGLQAEVLPVDTGTAHADLVLNMYEEGDRLRGKLIYNTDLFEGETIERMVGHFETLLASLVAEPGQRISEAVLLPEAERTQLLQEWNQAEVSYPPRRTLVDWFEAQAAQRPEKVAVVCEDERLTYWELNERSNQLAHYLRGLGIGDQGQGTGDMQGRPLDADVLVGICLERSVEMVVAILGVLKAGGAYVPIDPAYPAERMRFLLEDSGADVLLTHQADASRLSLEASDGRASSVLGPSSCVLLDADGDAIAQQPTHNPAVALSPEHLAYVIYTSGSTGQPKGVMVSHYNVVRLLQATHDWFGFDEHDVWTLFHSYAFDFSVWEMWGALLYGGRLVVVPFGQSRAPDAFYQLLVEEGVTVLNQTPSAFRQLIAAEARVGQQPRPEGTRLRLVIFGGEALELQSLAPWFERHGDECPQLVNMYGITETTVHVTYRPLTQADVEAGRGSVIGRAIPDLSLYLLDQHQQPVPVGVPGELYVGGAGVARGYLNRPQLTQERFIPNPFAQLSDRGEVTQSPSHPITQSRLYRSGDLARYLPNGDLEYLGRLDHQVKVRGFRIELGEIETALVRHEAVREAAVLVREDGGEKRLVAYVVGQDGTQDHPPSVSELRAWLGRSLPDYMVPSAFVFLDRLPLTTNDKLDRRALPAPAGERPALADAFVAPRTETERELAAIWADVLGLDQVGVHDNFFALGGHSLLATRLMSRVRDTFGAEVPLAALFATPTVAELSRQIEAAQTAEQRSAEPPLQPAPRDEPLPLAFSQRRLWFLEQLQPGNAAYSIPAAVRLTGPLNVAALQQSINEIVRRHEALRTSFAVVDGEPVQVIDPAQPMSLPLDDLRYLPRDAREAEAMRLVEAEAQRPFDLSQAPLLRLRMLQMDEDEHIAIVTMHHIISDAWSIGIFVQELAQLYEAFVAGRPSPLPELPIQYGDFAYWQRQWLQGEVLESHLAYWRRQLAGLPTLDLPTDKPRPSVQTFNGAWESLTLSADLVQLLHELSNREGVTLFMTLLATFKVLLHRYTGQDDIVVGADIANRNRSQTEGLIGFFVNQLVLRTDLSAPGGQSPTFRTLLQRVREMALEAFAHQDLPFDKLVEELQPKRDPSRNPLFQVMFILQNAPMPTLELPDLTLTPIPIQQETSVFDLSLIFTEAGGTGAEDGAMQMLCRYNTDLFTSATIARMLQHLETLFRNVVADPEARLNKLAILTESETKEKTVAQIKRKQSKFDKLMKVKPKTVNLSQEELIKTRYLQPEQTLPLVIEPNVEGVDLIEWADSHQSYVEDELLKHGAILFRGFDVPTVEKFEEFTRTLSPKLMEYGERSSPRHKVSGNVYTSTDHPADQPIVLHNEQSYTLNWMMKLWFYCAQPAQRGGSTPIASSRNIYKRLSPETIETFEQKQVMYMRNYGVGMGLPWQEVFGTDDRAAVEAYCRDHDIDFEWLGEGRLRTRQVRPAVRQHPKTGERVWFNHALFFHVSSLEESTRESLLAGMEEEDLPFNTYYGDGTPFEPEVLAEVRQAYEAETLSFPWQKGDILMLDNMLVAHGRDPYQGPRKVVVAMAEPYQSLIGNGNENGTR